MKAAAARALETSMVVHEHEDWMLGSPLQVGDWASWMTCHARLSRSKTKIKLIHQMACRANKRFAADEHGARGARVLRNGYWICAFIPQNRSNYYTLGNEMSGYRIWWRPNVQKNLCPNKLFTENNKDIVIYENLLQSHINAQIYRINFYFVYSIQV